MKILTVLAVLLVVFAFSGCTTPITKTRLYDGVNSAQISYDSQESGTHWIRPQELTYRPLEIVDYETEISLSRHYYIQEAVIFGYPQPGEEASPFITRAISEAIIKHKADGFLLSTYSIEYIDDNTDTALVLIHGRPLELVNLGEVEIDRADQERFITRIVVEENPDKGTTTTTKTTTPVALQNSQGLLAFPSSDFLQSGSAINVSDEQETSKLGKVLLWTGGIVGSLLVIGAVSSM